MLCVLMVLSVAGCAAGQKAEKTDDVKGAEEQQTGLPNPMVEMDSVDAVNDEIGCWIVPLNKEYFQISEEKYFVINGEPKIGEYRFKNGNNQYIIRAAISKEDISGIYMNDGKMPYEHLTEDNPYEIVDTGNGLWSRWFMGGMQYSLSSDVTDSDEYFNVRDYLAQYWPWYVYMGDEPYEEVPWTIQDMRDRVITDTMSMDKKFGTKGAILFESLSVDTLALWPGYKNIVSAATADEFLEKIAPDTMIVLPEGEINLSTASSYGTDTKGKYWYWEHEYDGDELVIHNVNNFCIVGNYKYDGTAVSLNSTVSTVPRYASVLYFKDCSAVKISALTAGHTEEPGECSGGVLYFDNCADCQVEDCNLYGCGVFGIETYNTRGLKITETVIHDCTQGHLSLVKSRDITVNKCMLMSTTGYDCVVLNECSNFTMTESDIAYNTANIIFRVYSGKGIVIRDCMFLNNYAEEGLISNLDGVELDDSAWLDYSMEKYEPVPAG